MQLDRLEFDQATVGPGASTPAAQYSRTGQARRVMTTSDPPAGFTGMWESQRRADGWDEWTCVDGAKTGPWRRLRGDGSVQRECDLVDGMFHGVMVTRGSVNQLLDRSRFVHGTGVYRIFTTDDRLASEIPIVSGRKHGLVRRLCDGVWVEEQWRDGARLSLPRGPTASQLSNPQPRASRDRINRES